MIKNILCTFEVSIILITKINYMCHVIKKIKFYYKHESFDVKNNFYYEEIDF
jgi:hypothetical protein